MKQIIEYLKKIDSIYVIGHNNIDADTYFSSYVLAKILRSFDINAHFTILDNYIYSDENRELINDYLKVKPLIINSKEIDNKNFIFVDHNEIKQSINNKNSNVLFAIDHHINSNQIKYCYTEEYTSTLLYIYKLFKDIYNFDNEDKLLIALSVMADSEFLTSTRYKETDKVLYENLGLNLDVNKLRDKYFKTTNFSLDINYNIINNYKQYNIENSIVNRVILKGYSNDKKYINNYLKEICNKYDNSLLIWIEYDTKKTFVFYNGILEREYNYVLTSSVLIIKDLIKENYNGGKVKKRDY